MDAQDWLAARFEEHRTHLKGVAYRMLGSLTEADDAVQEAWIRLSRTDTGDVANLRGWLTTVTARVCLDMLRSRTARREDPLDVHVPDPVVSSPDALDPEQEALLADSVGLALHVVLETLSPAERLAFVLHDMFAVPFDDIATVLGRSTAATKQLASRARRRVQGAAVPDGSPRSQHAIVAAFFAAARNGDFDALVAVLDPDVVVRTDVGPASRLSAVAHGAADVAGRTLQFFHPESVVRPALVNGAAGVVLTRHGKPVVVMGFTVRGGRIVAIDALADPDRLAVLDLSALD